MKHLIISISFFIVILLTSKINAQCDYPQSFLKFSESTNQIVDALDWYDQNVIYWDFSVRSYGLNINEFNYFTIPYYLQLYSYDLNDQTENCIDQWNYYGCIDLHYPVISPAVQLEFSLDENMFPTSDKIGFTAFAITGWTGNYEFTYFNPTSPTTDDQTAIYLNNTSNFGYLWSLTLQNPDPDYIPFKPIVFHELGHLIGLGHIYDTNGLYVMSLTRPTNQYKFDLTSCDIKDIQDLCNFNGTPTGIEDYIWIENSLEVWNVGTSCQSCTSPHFVDVWPYGDYITSWGNWEIKALHSCGGDILIYQCPYGGVITIPELPNGYNWIRDESGNVLANLMISGTDNLGITHRASTPIKIGNVPNFITSGTLLSDTYWCGEINLTGSITVPIDKTLHVGPGAIIKFPQNSSLIVQGKLDANHCTFTSLSGSTPGSWGSITFSGSSTSSSIINDCHVKYGAGIQCLNNANITISNSSIENCTNGIYINNSAPEIINNAISEPQQNGIYGTLATNYPLIENNTITKTSGGSGSYYHNYQGIWFTDHSRCLIAHNDVSGFYWGGYFGGSVYTLFADEMEGATNPSNRFTDCLYGIGSAYGSNVVAGSYNEGGYNTFYNNSYKDVYCYSSSWLYARYCYWGPDLQPSYYVDGSSYFYYDPTLTYDPLGSVSQSIASTGNSNMLSTVASSTESKNINTENTNFEEFLNGLKLERSGDIERAIAQYKKLIDTEAFTSFALTALSSIKTKYSRPDIGTYLDNLSVSKSKYKQEIMNLSANSLLLEGKYDEAMELYDQAIDINPSSDDAVNSLFEKFFAALNYKNDQSAAEKLLDNIKSVSTDNEDFMMRRELAESMLSGTSNSYQNTVNKSNVLNKNSSNELPKEYNLLGNYPNPFNPNTTISYALPYQSSVELIIYDIMGREIKSFNVSYQSAGYNKLVWDGRNENGEIVSSGVYFYRISIKSLENKESFVKTAKLMMMK